MDQSVFRRYFWVYLSAALLEGAVAIYGLTSLPADPKNAALFGVSSGRLALLGIVAVGMLALVVWGMLYQWKPGVREFTHDKLCGKMALRFIGLAGGLLGLIALVPPEAWGRWQPAFERLLPTLVWGALVLLQWLAVVWLSSMNFPARAKSWFRQNVLALGWPLIVFLVILLGFYAAAVLLYPGAADEDFWYENGVPLLLWQIGLAVAAGVLFGRYQRDIERKLGGNIDRVFFAAIFVLSGILWAATPLRASHFNPGPYPPNNVFYPDSDAANFDLQAQASFLGQGFNTGGPLDRPYYPLFLALIHLVVGQDYSKVMLVQAFLYGVFPAILYLICAEVGARKWGVLAAVATALWGQNYLLVSSTVNTGTPKQMMTDFPMVILLSLALWLGLRWFKGGRNAVVYAFLSGGVLVLAAYVRYSALPLLPMFGMAGWWIFRQKERRGLAHLALFAAGFLLVLLPWYARNLSVRGDFILPYMGKVNFVLEDRYQPVEPSDGSGEYTGEWSSRGNDLSKPLLVWAPEHFVHNVVSSLMVLPTSLEVSSIEIHLQRSGEIAAQYWDGTLSPLRLVFFTAAMFVLAVGLAALYRQDKRMLLLLLAMFIGVNLANTLGRTSGGRYILPVNWIVPLVYLGGILALTGQLAPDKQTAPIQNRRGVLRWGWAISLLVLVGMLPVVYEFVSIRVFSQPERASMFADLSELAEYGVPPEVILQLESKDEYLGFHAFEGAAFYPMQEYVFPQKRTASIIGEQGKVQFLSLKVLEADGNIDVLFPYVRNIVIDNQDAVYLIGCRADKAVIVRDLFVIRDSEITHYPTYLPFDECSSVTSNESP